jgi:hypothetical protein
MKKAASLTCEPAFPLLDSTEFNSPLVTTNIFELLEKKPGLQDSRLDP